MALTIGASAVTDWTAVAQNTIAESGIITLSSNYSTMLHLQAALDTTTAHTGTKFAVQVSSNATGDEDWQSFLEFVALIGTAVTDLIEDNPLAAHSTAIALTGQILSAAVGLGSWLFIEDGTLINSELIFLASQSTNEIVALDDTTNAHAQNTAIFSIAISRVIQIPINAGMRARVIVDNSYDVDGSTLNYKLRTTQTTAI